jgi:hypothetical protein
MLICIPRRLRRIREKPGSENFPFNVLMAGFMDLDGESRLVSVLYEPDLSTFKATGPPSSPKRLSMRYPSRYDSRFRLQISREDRGVYRCKKYRNGMLIAEAMAPCDNWEQFFFHVGLIGIAPRENCHIENIVLNRRAGASVSPENRRFSGKSRNRSPSRSDDGFG